MNYYFSLTSRYANEAKSDYEKRAWQRSAELDERYPTAEKHPMADGIGWWRRYDEGHGVLLAYVSMRSK